MTTKTTIDDMLEEVLSKARFKEEEKDPSKLERIAPPSRGICRRCGQNKPINRLMLCYPCWVKTELEKRGWREGEEHPSWCQCDIKDHIRRSTGN